MNKARYDIVIIGSGMGGLVCAAILGMEGYKVCVLEKNRQIGGCLQTYTRDKIIFDAGVHYLGGLAKGQNLYQLFSYLGIMEKLQLERMDMNAFDKIIIGNDDEEYVFAQGYENFIQRLLADFPKEEAALRSYCEKIKEVCGKFPMYNLRAGGTLTEKTDVMEIDTKTFIESITQDKKLQAVLVGNNMLYAGQPGKTPFYVHALILNSYIESAWKCINGGSQIAKLLAANIRKRNGLIRCNCEVKKIVVEDGKVNHVLTVDGEQIEGDYFISNMHPVQTLEMTDTPLIKNIYRNRLKSLENSISSFSLNIIFKEGCFPYHAHNYYYFKEGRVWDMAEYTEENWPLGYIVFLSPGRAKGFAASMTILTYMKYEEVQAWQNTFNTVSEEEHRGADYDAFKKRKAEKLVATVEERFPGLAGCIQSMYSATPLSYRDYLGNGDGSMYGIVKDSRSPIRTFIPARTQVSNLFFTGQNLNLHGILGAAISGLVTCTELLGNEDLVEKIKNA